MILIFIKSLLLINNAHKIYEIFKLICITNLSKTVAIHRTTCFSHDKGLLNEMPNY